MMITCDFLSESSLASAFHECLHVCIYIYIHLDVDADVDVDTERDLHIGIGTHIQDPNQMKEPFKAMRS